MSPDRGEKGAGSKERIYHATVAVALRHGFGKVTMSLVAREAGFSKGGLLYHFMTKDDLFRAMLEHYAGPSTAEGGSAQAGGSNSCACEPDPFAVAVLIAAAENPALLEPFGDILRSVGTGTDGRLEPARGSLPLTGSLANRLGLAGTAPDHAADEGGRSLRDRSGNRHR